MRLKHTDKNDYVDIFSLIFWRTQLRTQWDGHFYIVCVHLLRAKSCPDQKFKIMGHHEWHIGKTRDANNLCCMLSNERLNLIYVRSRHTFTILHPEPHTFHPEKHFDIKCRRGLRLVWNNLDVNILVVHWSLSMISSNSVHLFARASFQIKQKFPHFIIQLMRRFLL